MHLAGIFAAQHASESPERIFNAVMHRIKRDDLTRARMFFISQHMQERLLPAGLYCRQPALL